MADEDGVKLRESLFRLHEVFTMHAAGTRRFVDLGATPSEEMVALQFDVYKMGSANVSRIAARAPAMTRLFLDFKALKFDVKTLTEWQAAAWVRYRVASGAKTAGANALSSLNLLGRCTGEPTHADSALVIAQAKPKRGATAPCEPPVSAIALRWTHIQAIEGAVRTARTSQQRAYAGFFAFLIHTSARCMDGQRSRGVHLTDDALVGESMMKGKTCWTKWAALRDGYFESDWAADWLSGLHECGLPGPDFMLRATNVGMDEWLDRPARHADFGRALHVLLMAYANELPEDVVAFTPHGCRHVQVTAAQQLAQQHLLTENAVESLGHWERGSRMPRKYDAASCVTELSARKTIADAISSGWRPAADGELPALAQSSTSTPPTASAKAGAAIATAFAAAATAADPIDQEEASVETTDMQQSTVEVNLRLPRVVYHIQRRRVHLWRPPSQASVCGWWSCGSPDAPTAFAVFDPETTESIVRCRKCFGE